MYFTAILQRWGEGGVQKKRGREKAGTRSEAMSNETVANTTPHRYTHGIYTENEYLCCTNYLHARRYPLMIEVGWILYFTSSSALFSNSAASITCSWITNMICIARLVNKSTYTDSSLTQLHVAMRFSYREGTCCMM